MTIENFIDHTNLKTDASETDIEKLAKEANEYHFNSICIRLTWLEKFTEKYKCSAVIDFPKEIITVASDEDLKMAKEIIGNSSLEEKTQEAKQALEAGALELDPVIRIGKPELIQEELRAYIELMAEQEKELWLKPIFSCEILSWEEINYTIEAFAREVSRHYALKPDSKLKFAYKNSTGFIKHHCQEEASATDVAIHFKPTSTELISFIAEKLDLNDPVGRIHIKAAGGIRDLETAKKIIMAARGRLSHIGTSSGIDVCPTSPPRKSVT